MRFDGDTLEQLAKLAALKNMSFANLVRVACEVYLAKQELADELDGMKERLSAQSRPPRGWSNSNAFISRRYRQRTVKR